MNTEMYLHPIDFVVIAIYMLGLLALGVFFALRQTGKSSYFLGNRRMPWFLAGISVIATLLSSASYLSVPGEAIRYGLAYFTSLLSFFLIVPIVNYLIIPFLMRLEITSVYEYIEQRFNLGARLMAASAFIFSRLIWTGLIIYMTAFAIASMTGWNITVIILVIGVTTTIYTTMGGISAVVWSDLVQFFILLGGALFVPLYILFAADAGPLTWMQTFNEAGRTEIPVFSLDPNVRITVVGVILSMLIWNICTHGADQVAAQRYLSTPSLKAARRSVWIFSIANVSLIALLGVVGVALFYYFFLQSGLSVQEFQEWIAPDADRAFPRFIATGLPIGLSGLILAALLSAAMSSLSSSINSISSVAVTDFFDRLKILLRYQDSLFLSMATAILTGLIGIFFALGINGYMQTGEWNLTELISRLNHLFVAPLGVLFFVGFLFPRAGPAAAIGGFLAGTATSVSLAFNREIFGMEQPISFVWILPLAFFASFLFSALISLFVPAGKGRTTTQ